ncbi:MAG: hypothetical protein AAEJ52_14435, partial [Myxococcota bacterium]
ARRVLEPRPDSQPSRIELGDCYGRLACESRRVALRRRINRISGLMVWSHAHKARRSAKWPF